MSGKSARILVVALTSIVTVCWLVGTAAADTRTIGSSGTTSIRSAPYGIDVLQQPELRGGPGSDEGVGIPNKPPPGVKKGVFPKKPLDAPKVKSSSVAGSSPELVWSTLGLNHRDQRLANGGNQFSLEPPDQGLCVGNGYTVEATNSVLRVYSSATGAPVTGVQDLNTFFGYPAQINRTTIQYGPDVIDPVCLFDASSDRFIVAITTLYHVGTTSAYSGKNTIDLAVSNSGDPTGAWTIYSVPAQNDGADGTPDHGCTLDGSTPGPCFQDYPHIGADANGVYITTNEYDLFGPSYSAAQVFAFSKAELAAHGAIRVTLVENLAVDGTPGFTVWPAISNAGDYATDANGTEYFLSTIAGDGSETGNPTGTAKKLGLWALTNTQSLDAAVPSPAMSSRTINSQAYVFPSPADQKPGDIPLADCINNTTTPTIFGPGCWQLIFFDEPAHDEVEATLDSGDTRMQQVWYANGTLWGSSGTAVKVGDDIKTGIAWFQVDPKVNGKGKVEGHVKKDGYIALEHNNLTYPAIAMGANGKGAIAFTVVGQDYYPSAGYATIDDKGKVGPIHIAATGAGPSDGFSDYKAFRDPPRPRWGDYGAAVTDGNSIWIASEYIAQTCSYATYYPSPPSTAGFGSCGATRTSLANWATRISKITP